MKKVCCLIISMLLAVTCLAGCNKTSEDKTADNGEPIEVNIWWILGGTENEIMQGLVERFNDSQDTYKVIGTSISDLDKIVTAVSSGEGPDAFWGFSSLIPTYAEQGIIAPLDDYEKSDEDFSWDEFTDLSVEGCSYNGKVYGMPVHTSVCALYYSVDLIEEAGLTKEDLVKMSWEDIYDLSIDLTKVDENGDIDVMGYPLYDENAYLQDAVYSMGGRYVDENGNYTCTDKNIAYALDMNLKYRKTYGFDAINKFISNAASTAYTADDPFFNNKQAFRIDGDWMCNLASVAAPDFEYGILPLPATESNPDDYGTSRCEAGFFAITSTAKEAEGAWEAIKFITTDKETSEEMALGFNWVPANVELFDLESIQNEAGFAEYIDIINMNKGVFWPMIPNGTEYLNKVTEYAQYIFNGSKTVEGALQEVQDYMTHLK